MYISHWHLLGPNPLLKGSNRGGVKQQMGPSRWSCIPPQPSLFESKWLKPAETHLVLEIFSHFCGGYKPHKLCSVLDSSNNWRFDWGSTPCWLVNPKKLTTSTWKARGFMWWNVSLWNSKTNFGPTGLWEKYRQLSIRLLYLRYSIYEQVKHQTRFPRNKEMSLQKSYILGVRDPCFWSL